jgi:GNAT superfamily N-acetyltransferase
MDKMFIIRPPRLPDEKPALLAFIDGLQAFEYDIVPNRRRDATVAAEHFAKLERDMAEFGGAIFVASAAPDGPPLGWTVVIETNDDAFIVEAERRFAYIAELFLVEAMRGQGAGRALIDACADWAKGRGLGILAIGVLTGNRHAHDVYRRAGFADYSVQLRKYL